jgi:hypothetical protein
VKDYKRLTAKCEAGIGLTESSGNLVNDYEKVVNRLAELEDKIENGTLVEIESPCTEEELERELIHIEIQNMIRSLSVPGKYYSLHEPKQKR